MKKNKEKVNSKITDFFQSGQSEEEQEENNDKYIDIFEKIDIDPLLNNNHGKNQLNYNNNIYKKKKLEENISLSINNLNLNHSSFFINLNSQSPVDEKRNLILVDFNNINKKKIELNKIILSPNNFINPDDYNNSFPYQNCRLININNNITYIIGGKKTDEISKLKYNNNLGENAFYKIICNSNKKGNINLEEIKISQLPSSIFQHQSHSVIYCPKFDSIIVLSGYEQKNCEYFNIKENKWEILYPLRKPRENAISFLFNEKYIFIIGGKYQEKNNDNYDYDVIDFEIFLSKQIQSYWKTYEIYNNYKINFLKCLGCGIICKNDNVYIFGGLNNEYIKHYKNNEKNNNNNEFFSYKINFEKDEEDKKFIYGRENYDKIYKIKNIDKCDNINNTIKKFNKDNILGFFGQQKFLHFNGFFFNISYGGQLALIPENIF